LWLCHWQGNEIPICVAVQIINEPSQDESVLPDASELINRINQQHEILFESGKFMAVGL
jgi:hypothetical protein